MVTAQPHFLLFCDTHLSQSAFTPTKPLGGRWHFVLEQLGSDECLEAADYESATNGERLALLSVVRGLEALEQPSTVTLVTTSRYVSRGLRFGLSSWRESDYLWERFGAKKPIRNADLWRRVDCALSFHGVTCRLLQSHSDSPGMNRLPANQATDTDADAVAEVASDELVSEYAHAPGSTQSFPPAEPAELVAAAARTVTGEATRSEGLLASPSPTDMNWERQNLFSPIHWQEIWWKLATNWIKWGRGRLQARPAIYGT